MLYSARQSPSAWQLVDRDLDENPVALLAKLLAQRRPPRVVQVGETGLAPDADTAREILVEALPRS